VAGGFNYKTLIPCLSLEAETELFIKTGMTRGRIFHQKDRSVSACLPSLNDIKLRPDVSFGRGVDSFDVIGL